MKIRKTHLMTKSVYVLTLKKEKTLESHASVTADACFFLLIIIYFANWSYLPVLPKPPERSISISSSSSTIKYLVKMPWAILSPIWIW